MGNKEQYPYNHRYKMRTSLDYKDKTYLNGVVNPSDYFTESGWNLMTDKERKQFLDDHLRDWAITWIKTSITK